MTSKITFKTLDQDLLPEITTEIAKLLHKAYMADITQELPTGHAMICPFATAFAKHPEDPIDYLVEKHGAQVFETGYHYCHFMNQCRPYTWSSVIIRIPKNNKIFVFYKTDRHPATILFTAYFKEGEIITERFYYKKGEEALLSGNMFLSQPKDIPDNTSLKYLADLAGYHLEDMSFQVQESDLTWANPDKIMDTLQKHAKPFITDIDGTYKDMYGDQSYYILEVMGPGDWEGEDDQDSPHLEEGDDKDSDDWHDPTTEDWYMIRYG
jgi:hypothetical protein